MPYAASNHALTNKSLGIAQAVPTDARSYFYDSSLFKARPYQSVTEVLAYLNTANSRTGQFPIYVSSGTLNTSTGAFAGGSITTYWFKDGTADNNLVVLSNAVLDNTNKIASAYLPDFFLDPNNFTGSGTVGDKVKVNPLAISAYLSSLPGYAAGDNTLSLRADFTWGAAGAPASTTTTTTAAGGTTLPPTTSTTTTSPFDGGTTSTTTTANPNPNNYVHESEFIGQNGTNLTAYTPEFGNAWTPLYGAGLQLFNNHLIGLTDTGNGFRAVTNVGKQNVDISITAAKGDASLNLMFYVNATDESNATLIQRLGTSYEFYNIVNGSASHFGSIGNDFDDTNIHIYRIVSQGAGGQLVLYRDGVMKTTVTLPAGQTGTKMGVGFTGTAGVVTVDSFTVK